MVTRGNQVVCNTFFLQWIVDSCRLSQILADTCRHLPICCQLKKIKWNNKIINKWNIWTLAMKLQTLCNCWQSGADRLRQLQTISFNAFFPATRMNCYPVGQQFLACLELSKNISRFDFCLQLLQIGCRSIGDNCQFPAIWIKCGFMAIRQYSFHVWMVANCCQCLAMLADGLQQVCNSLQLSTIYCKK